MKSKKTQAAIGRTTLLPRPTARQDHALAALVAVCSCLGTEQNSTTARLPYANLNTLARGCTLAGCTWAGGCTWAAGCTLAGGCAFAVATLRTAIKQDSLIQAPPLLRLCWAEIAACEALQCLMDMRPKSTTPSVGSTTP